MVAAMTGCRLPFLLLAGPLLAAADLLVPTPVVVGNPYRYPTGHQASLEGGAVLARVGGAEAAWTNPAGLMRTGGLSTSASANLYSYDVFEVSNAGTSYRDWEAQVIPACVGGSFAVPGLDEERWRAAAFITQPQMWTNEVVFHRVVDNAAGERAEALNESSGRLETLCPGLALGTAITPSCRLGARVNLRYLSYRRQTLTSVTQRDAGGDENSTLALVNRFGFYHLQASIASQVELGDGWSAGTAVILPGVQIWQFGRVSLASQMDDASVHTSTLGFDDDPQLRYRQPTEVHLGIGRSTPRWGIEIDVRIRASAGSYTIAASDRPLSIQIQDTATGALSSAQGRMPTISAATAGGIGWSAGGHFRVSPTLVGHLGIWYDPSPVRDASDDLLTPLSIYGASLGGSYAKDDLAVSVGLLASAGQARGIPLFFRYQGGTASANQAANQDSTLSVLGLGMVVSTSVRF